MQASTKFLKQQPFIAPQRDLKGQLDSQVPVAQPKCDVRTRATPWFEAKPGPRLPKARREIEHLPPESTVIDREPDLTAHRAAKGQAYDLRGLKTHR